MQSYAENEYALIAKIYQPPLQYHYLKRPYELIPFAATEVPRPQLLRRGRPAPARTADAKDVAYSVYEIHIRPGILYQPHPAFATDGQGRPAYQDLRPRDLDGVNAIGDFKRTGTRELVADDYVYQIKRLAHPRLHSPIMRLMSEYIVGLKDLRRSWPGRKRQPAARPQDGYLDLTRFNLAGAEVVDRYTYRIRVKGKYPQFVYWLAMPFFAPMPCPRRTVSIRSRAWRRRTFPSTGIPVGTGPYMLTVNNPNRQMVLERNPNFAASRIPRKASRATRQAGLLEDAGKPMPFIDKVVFTLEKEAIPYWNKFLQGYYDVSGIGSDNFDQAVRYSAAGRCRARRRNGGARHPAADVGGHHRVSTSASTCSIPVVGGDSERARKLRQAISIAIDQEESSRFSQRARHAAQGPIPPGIFGYREGEAGINPVRLRLGERQAAQQADRGGEEAAGRGGLSGRARRRRPASRCSCISTPPGRGPGAKARMDWYASSSTRSVVQLVVRATDWNRFQEKMRKGNAQLYFLGWNADYPDPENFLFLLYGPQSKVKTRARTRRTTPTRNSTACSSAWRTWRTAPSARRSSTGWSRSLRHDAPWVWGLYPKDFALAHAWVHNRKPQRDGEQRPQVPAHRSRPCARRSAGSGTSPFVWPVAALLAAIVLSVIPAVRTYRRRERQTAKA